MAPGPGGGPAIAAPRTDRSGGMAVLDEALEDLEAELTTAGLAV
jgi:hypothetical protein